VLEIMTLILQFKKIGNNKGTKKQGSGFSLWEGIPHRPSGGK
jgi:hypothetical protein